jgi:hypothetical protein
MLFPNASSAVCCERSIPCNSAGTGYGSLTVICPKQTAGAKATSDAIAFPQIQCEKHAYLIINILVDHQRKKLNKEPRKIGGQE